MKMFQSHFGLVIGLLVHLDKTLIQKVVGELVMTH